MPRAFALGGVVPVKEQREFLGRVGIERYREICTERGVRWGDLRVLVDGLDVTDECRVFDDEEGWAEVMKRNDKGAHYSEWGQAATRKVLGTVTLQLRERP